MIKDKIAGGYYGLLIGDALGVPYEFHKADQLPGYDEIEMTPPSGFKRAHAQVEPGTWSDDGAQALCLMECLLNQGRFSLENFSELLFRWYEDGLWAVENKVFDVGIQSAHALHAYGNGLQIEKCGLLNSNGKGNGALMRVLPLAFWHEDKMQLVLDAHMQCLITHGHICNQVCCALYCLAARALLSGAKAHEAIEESVALLRQIYQDMPEYEQELEWSIRPETSWEGTGTGYVVDCLRSAFMLLEQTSSYEESVKRAVLLGNDTDTTACVTGGLTGILYGVQDIPERWLSMLKERDKAAGLLERFFDVKGYQ